MKITRAQLKQLIKEELEQALDEAQTDELAGLVDAVRAAGTPESIVKHVTREVKKFEDMLAKYQSTLSELYNIQANLLKLPRELIGFSELLSDETLGSEKLFRRLKISVEDYSEEMMDKVTDVADKMGDIFRDIYYTNR